MRPTPASRFEQKLHDLNIVFRRLSATVRGIDNFDRFASGLCKTLEWISEATGRQIRFDALPAGEAPAGAFSTPELHAPVGTRNGVGGLIIVSPPDGERPFGPEDLHLVGTLAEFTSALLDIAVTARDRDRLVDILRQVYDQLPIGVVCFGVEGEPLFSNARSRVILRGAAWVSEAEALAFLATQSTEGEGTDGCGKYSFIGPSGTVLADVQKLGSPDHPKGTAVFLAEFESQRRNLHHVLAREIFRSRWMGQSLAFVAVETAGDPARLFAQLPELRRTLRSTDLCDFLGDRRIGVVLPGRERSQALRIARVVCRGLPGEQVSVGCSLLGGAGERVESMIEATLGTMAPAGDLARPRLLVVDRYRAVSDAVELVIGDQFVIERAGGFEDALQRLRTVPLDAVMVEHEPEQGCSALPVLETASALQPDALGVLTTTRHDWGANLPSIPETYRVIGKPFSVDALKAVLAPAAEGGGSRP